MELKAIPRNAREKVREGYFPAVAYNKDRNVTFAVETRTFDRIFREVSTHGLIDLQMEGGETLPVLVRTVQMDPRKRSVRHADFFLVTYGQEIEVPVPVHTTGKAKGVRENAGILDIVLHNLPIVAPGPRRIPAEVVVDVTKLDIGDSIHAGEITLPEGCRLAVDPGTTVVAILPPQKIVEEVVEAAVAADEVPAIEVDDEENDTSENAPVTNAEPQDKNAD